MRSDMKKVVTERPRSGGRIKSPKGDRRQWQRYEMEDCPKREKIRAKWKSWRKDFTDLLGPLHRFLLGQVGRPWDIVYSEIARNLPKTSLQNLHVYTHLWQFVLKEVRMINGVACHNRGYWAGVPIASWGRYPQLYIHPLNGLLCKAKPGNAQPRYHRPPKIETTLPGIKVYPGVQYHKVRGVWYEVAVEKRHVAGEMENRYPYRHGIKDEVLGRYYESEAKWIEIYGGRYLAVSKRPLKGREIRFAGLK